MTLTTASGVLDALPGRMVAFNKIASSSAGFGSGTGNPILSSLWRQGDVPAAGAIPPTGVGEVPTRATTGALDMGANAGSGNTQYLGRFRLWSTGTTTVFAVLHDRLVHTSGLDGTVTTAQTINSVSVNRPDSTAADAVAFVEIYSSLGGSGQSATVSYTNQSGTAGRAGSVVIGSNARAGDLYPVCVQAGDTGVRSVESLTLAGSTGSAGNFGITILRVIAFINAPSTNLFLPPNERDWLDCALATIDADACLAFAQPTQALSARFLGEIGLIEG